MLFWLSSGINTDDNFLRFGAGEKYFEPVSLSDDSPISKTSSFVKLLWSEFYYIDNLLPGLLIYYLKVPVI